MAANLLSTSSAFARTLPTSLSSRTVYVRVSPAPANFSERRAVLRALEKTTEKTEIEMFKRLEETSSYIAITKTASEAEQLVNDSPFSRTFVSQDATAKAAFATTSWGAAFRGSITDPVTVLPPGAPATSSAKLGTTAKTFTIRVFPAHTKYNHESAVRVSALHGPWPLDRNRHTLISKALDRSIPSGAMRPGLRNWETGQQLRVGGAARIDELGAETILGGSPGRAFAAERARRAECEARIPAVMRSLRAVASPKEVGGGIGPSLAVRGFYKTALNLTKKEIQSTSGSEEENPVVENEVRSTLGAHSEPAEKQETQSMLDEFYDTKPTTLKHQEKKNQQQPPATPDEFYAAMGLPKTKDE